MLNVNTQRSKVGFVISEKTGTGDCIGANTAFGDICVDRSGIAGVSVDKIIFGKPAELRGVCSSRGVTRNVDVPSAARAGSARLRRRVAERRCDHSGRNAGDVSTRIGCVVRREAQSGCDLCASDAGQVVAVVRERADIGRLRVAEDAGCSAVAQ